MGNGQPTQKAMQVDPRTAQMVAGTAVMLLDQLCQDQKRGERVLVGDSNYTIVENGRNLDILFRGDKTREPTTILQLRTYQQEGKSTSVISTNLASQDIDRFARINQKLAYDLQHQKQVETLPTPGIEHD